MAPRIEKAFGAKMDTLLRMETAYDLAANRNRQGDIKSKRDVGKPCTSRQAPLFLSGF
jgi:plasmid maintenance system antidote protein VapI